MHERYVHASIEFNVLLYINFIIRIIKIFEIQIFHYHNLFIFLNLLSFFLSQLILILQFFVAVSNYTGASKDDKLKFAFMVFDDEGNGVITRAELLKMLKANHMAMNDSEVSRKADTIMVNSSHWPLHDIFYPLSPLPQLSPPPLNILFSSSPGSGRQRRRWRHIF